MTKIKNAKAASNDYTLGNRCPNKVLGKIFNPDELPGSDQVGEVEFCAVRQTPFEGEDSLRVTPRRYTKQRGALLWTTGTTRNVVFCFTPRDLIPRRHSGVLLLRPLVCFYSGVDSRGPGERQQSLRRLGILFTILRLWGHPDA